MKLYEQADKTGGETRYSWLLDAPYRMKKALEPLGWKWVKGRPGCFTHTCLLAVIITARQYKLGKPESNGTHKAVKVEMEDWDLSPKA